MSPAPRNKTRTSGSATTSAGRPFRLSFSLGSMLVIMVVVAFLGAILSQLYRSINDPIPANVGYFALAAAFAPSAILIIAGTVFKALSWLKQRRLEHVANSDL